MTQINQAVEFFKTEFKIKLEILDFDVLRFEPSELSDQLPKSASTYFRMFLAELLPQEVEKVLYLDSDTVILGKLDQLINQKLSDFYFLAVPECLFTLNSVPRKLLQNNLIGRHYFNTGMMFINLDKWRDELVSNHLLQNGQNYKDLITYWDQDILNIYFKDRIGEVDGRFNSFILFNRINPDPTIIHYAGSVKPWQIINPHPYRAEYKFFRNQTPFRFRSTFKVSLRLTLLQFLHKSRTAEKILEFLKGYRRPK
jgi:lipopolysaccharide biosynthesis glycosyltransferase